MIGYKLSRFIKTRFFTAILESICLLLIIITYYVGKNAIGIANTSSIISFIIGLISIILSTICIISDTRIAIPIKGSKRILLDQRSLSILTAIIYIIIDIVMIYTIPGLLIDLLIASIFWLLILNIIFFLLTGIQSHFTKTWI